IGTPAITSNTVRNRRFSSAERRTGGAALSSPITSANYRLGITPSNTKNEAAPAADTASTGNPPGDTRLVFCAALRPLPTCGGQPLRGLSVVPDGERIASTVQRSGANVKGFGLFLVYYI